VILMREMLSDLEDLSNAIGVSGFEARVRELISDRIDGLADEVRTDGLGNLLVTKEGTCGGPRILLDAHMDEVGFMVSHVDDRGFLRFECIGGWDPRNLLGHPVRFDLVGGFIEGIIGTKPPHLQTADERKKVVETDRMFVDVGAVDAGQVEGMGIEVGTPFTIYHPFRHIGGGNVMGKAFDDRVGCAVMIEVLRRLSKVDHGPTITMNFAVCEEVGLRGSGPGAFTLKPDLALALENTAAGDIPGVSPERCPTELGGGPAITIADKSLIASPELVSRLRQLAKEKDLPYQIKKPLYGGTDAGRISTTGSGIPSGVLSIPCRYIHNGLSVLRVSDMEACTDLALAFCVDAD